MAVELHPHQKKAVDELGNGKILVGDVGVGKSITAAAYYMQQEKPRDVFVITTAKKRDSGDWQEEFAKFAIGTSQDATIAGVLTVDSWNNIGNYTSVHGAFFIFDEQRLVGSGAWTKAFVHIAKSNHWILLSATPGDTWLDYIPVFVANGFYKNRTEFKREHVVYNHYARFPKVDHYIGVGKLVRYRNQLLVEMPYIRHTTRIIRDLIVEYDSDKLERVMKDRWNPFEEKPVRDIAELFGVARKVVNTSPTRLSTVEQLSLKHPRLIVFYSFDYELEELRRLSQNLLLQTIPKSFGASSSQASDQSKSLQSQAAATDMPTSRTSTSTTTGTDSSEKSSLGSETTRISTKTSTGQSSPKESEEWDPESGFRTSSPDSSTSGTTGETEEWNKSCGGSSSQMAKRSGCHEQSSTGFFDTIESSTSSDASTACTEEGVSEWRTQQPASTESSVAIASMAEGSTTSASAATQRSQMSTGKDESTSSSPSSRTGSKSDLASFAVAEWNGHKHEPIPDTDRWIYLVQYVAGSEGWNCTTTDAMVFYSLTYSYKNWHQAHGRIDRLNTPFDTLYYYVLRSNSWIDNAVYKSLKTKKTFNESAFAKKMGFDRAKL